MLIAILIISTLVIGWNKISDYNRKKDIIETVEQINAFNKEFESYNKGVVRGYELLSLKNLVQDTNERYSEISGVNSFKELKAYIKLLSSNILIENIGESKQKKQLTTGFGLDLSKFIDNYYGKDSDFDKMFKESYFQCDRFVYDGENDEKKETGSGRVEEMYFTQIERIN